MPRPTTGDQRATGDGVRDRFSESLEEAGSRCRLAGQTPLLDRCHLRSCLVVPPVDTELNPLLSLLIRIELGDLDAFRDLHDLTCVQLSSVIRRTVSAPDHSVEVLQEVFLYVWQNAGAYDVTRGPVIGWLKMVARHRAVDRVRSVARSRARDQREYSLTASVSPDVADIGIARHEAAQLRRTVDRLSLVQRDAVALTYLDGYSHQEAAELLKIPLGTLKSRIRLGVASLRQLLDVPVAA